MGRVKIIGHEKCSHVNKKTGKRCNRRGRYNPKPMVTWNTKLKLDNYRKRKYRYFIHNDGSRHYISNVSNVIHPDKEAKKRSRLYNSIPKAWLTTPWQLTLKPADREDLVSQLANGNKEPFVKAFKEYDSKRRKAIYDRTKGLPDEDYSYRQTISYQALKDLVQAEMPLSQTLIDQWSFFFEPETVSRIKAEKWRHLKNQMLRLHDDRQLKRISISDQRKRRKALSSDLALLQRNLQ